MAANILLDTGATASLVSTAYLDNIGKISNIVPTSIRVAGLSNKLIPMRGEIKLSVAMASTRTEHNFIVCDILGEDILAGTDLMEKLEVRIDIPDRRVFTKHGDEEFLHKPCKLNKRLKIRCKKTTIIPANSVQYFNGKISTGARVENNYEGILLGYNNLVENAGVCVENALVYSSNNVVPVRCLNPMPFDVTLTKNRIVGFMEPLRLQENIRGAHYVADTNEYPIDIGIPRLPGAEMEETTRNKGRWKDMNELYRQLKIDDIDASRDIKSELKDLIAEFSHCFSRDKFDLGEASFYEAELNLKRDYVAKWVPSREISYKLRPHMESEVGNLVDSGQIERCDYSLWNSCVFLVKKPDGKSHRLVQDMRQLNTQCLPDNFELPKINTIMDKMSECEYMTSFDFTKGFNQIKLKKNSRQLTAFSYGGERYQWARLPMGQTSSSSQFARAMSHLFARIPFQALICFLDDVLIGSVTANEHLRRLRFVLARLSWGNLKISPSKTQLLRKQVRFLGQIICKQGISIDPQRTAAILKLKAPTSVKELQKFLGTMNWNRQFIKEFSSIASPLYKMTRKSCKFDWGNQCQLAFENLKKALTTTPVLAIPRYDDPEKSYELTIDSSKIGHGSTLTQVINGERRIISYWSKAVPEHMQKFGASRLEFLGLYFSLMHFRIYLEGTDFLVKTDCRALLNLATVFRNENSYIQRRLAEIQSFRFKVVHVSGESNQIQMADYLSRHPILMETTEVGTQTGQTGFESEFCRRNSSAAKTGRHCQDSDSEEFFKITVESDVDIESSDEETTEDDRCRSRIDRVMREFVDRREDPVTMEEIKKESKDDRVLAQVITWLESGEAPTRVDYRNQPAELCHYRQYLDLISIKDGVLYRRWIDPKDRSKDRDLIVVPKVLMERIMYMHHNGNCHAGAATALAHCRRKFYFYKQSRQFKLYCDACITCARAKQPHSYKKAPLKPIVYHHFGQCIAIDYLEPSKQPTKRGHTALLTIVDMFTNYLVCYPVRSTGSEEAIRVIIKEWILKFGVPANLMHDLGSSFTSKLFKAVLKVYNIRDVHGVPWHSQTNGRAESFNKKINVCMRTCLKDNQWQDYDKWIGYIVFTLNNLRSTKTGYSSNFLVFGRHLHCPADLFVPDNSRIEEIHEGITEDDHKQLLAYEHYRDVSELTRKVTENSERKADQMKRHYDRKVKGPFFNSGDWCMLLVPRKSHKYSPTFTGPYKVNEKLSDWNYIVDVEGEKRVTNIGKMKLYKPNHYTPQISSQTPTPTTPGDPGNERIIPPIGEINDSSDSDNDTMIMTRSRTRQQNKAGGTQSRNTSASGEDRMTATSPAGDNAQESGEEATTPPSTTVSGQSSPETGRADENSAEFRGDSRSPTRPVSTNDPSSPNTSIAEDRHETQPAASQATSVQRSDPASTDLTEFREIDTGGFSLRDLEDHENKNLRPATRSGAFRRPKTD